MCQETEQMNSDLTNLFKSSRVLNQTAFWLEQVYTKQEQFPDILINSNNHNDERYAIKLPWK